MFERHERQTGEVAPAMAKRPSLSNQNEIYNDAFNLLSSGRQNTDHVINPILFSDVMTYCDCIGELDGEERLRYWRMVNACDIAFVTATVEQRAVAARIEAAKEKVKSKG